jgi:molybdopterin synthase sulfur carrier subunit
VVERDHGEKGSIKPRFMIASKANCCKFTVMEVRVITFGSLADIVDKDLSVPDVLDTNALVTELNIRYPQLKNSKYLIAVNKKMINGNTALRGDDNVALMSPFSGG